MRSRALVTAVLVLLPGGCDTSSHEGPEDTGARARAARADSIVAGWVDAGVIAGAVLRASIAGRPVIDRAYGWAEQWEYGEGQYGRWAEDDTAEDVGSLGIRPIENPVPMSTETRFDMASVTKVMATTFAVMLLVDDGALELDASVARLLPGFPEEPWNRVTVRHLLTHRAGLAQWQPIYMSAQEPDEAFRVIREMPLEWPPGGERHYSDLGFMMLGRIVESVSGASLEDLLRERLYTPLDLGATGFRIGRPSSPRASGGIASADGNGPYAATSHGNPFEYRMVHDTTFGYLYGGDPEAWGGWRRYTLAGEANDGNAYHAFGGMAGHAGLFSTVGELDTLLQVLLNGGVYRGRRFLSEGVVRTFLAPVVEGQALGWQVPPDAPSGSFFHTGFTGTYVAGVPDQRLSLVLLTNRQHGGVDGSARYPDVDPLRRAVLGVLLADRPARTR